MKRTPLSNSDLEKLELTVVSVEVTLDVSSDEASFRIELNDGDRLFTAGMKRTMFVT